MGGVLGERRGGVRGGVVAAGGRAREAGGRGDPGAGERGLGGGERRGAKLTVGEVGGEMGGERVRGKVGEVREVGGYMGEVRGEPAGERGLGVGRRLREGERSESFFFLFFTAYGREEIRDKSFGDIFVYSCLRLYMCLK